MDFTRIFGGFYRLEDLKAVSQGFYIPTSMQCRYVFINPKPPNPKALYTNNTSNARYQAFHLTNQSKQEFRREGWTETAVILCKLNKSL